MVDDGDVCGRGVADGECRSGSHSDWRLGGGIWSYGRGRVLGHLVGGAGPSACSPVRGTCCASASSAPLCTRTGSTTSAGSPTSSRLGTRGSECHASDAKDLDQRGRGGWVWRVAVRGGIDLACAVGELCGVDPRRPVRMQRKSANTRRGSPPTTSSATTRPPTTARSRASSSPTRKSPRSV